MIIELSFFLFSFFLKDGHQILLPKTLTFSVVYFTCQDFCITQRNAVSRGGCLSRYIDVSLLVIMWRSCLRKDTVDCTYWSPLKTLRQPVVLILMHVEMLRAFLGLVTPDYYVTGAENSFTAKLC